MQGVLTKFLFPDFSEETDVFLAARKRLVHVMCLMSCLITLIYIAEGSYSSPSGNFHYTYVIGHIFVSAIYLGLAGLVAWGYSVKFAAVVYLISYYFFVLWMRFESGLFSPGIVYFIAIPMVAAMMMGMRAGLISAALVAVTYLGLYMLQMRYAGSVQYVDINDYALQSVISYSVLGVACCVSALYFMHVMNGVAAKLHSANSELEAYRRNLEDLVEERTRTIREQAAELERALSTERETNALQNQLVSVVSHEIRTPLAIIDGSARRISRQSEKADPEDLKRRSEVIRQNVLRLTQLVERTLESARYAEGMMDLQNVRFDFRALLESVLERQYETVPQHAFEFDLDAVPAMAMGDPNLLDHVFSNIIGNAVKYSPEASLVSLRSETEGGELVIRVRDRGIGIPKDELSKIASRFYRARTALNIPGTGVGLALSRQILEDHGARLEVDSEEGAWTEVSVYFQLAELMPDFNAENEKLAG